MSEIRDRIDNALEWLLTFAASKAVDFLIVALVVVTIVYLAIHVIAFL